MRRQKQKKNFPGRSRIRRETPGDSLVFPKRIWLGTCFPKKAWALSPRFAALGAMALIFASFPPAFGSPAKPPFPSPSARQDPAKKTLERKAAEGQVSPERRLKPPPVKDPDLGEAPAAPKRFDYPAFSRLPVLHGGRVKPLGSFAREHLKLLSGKPRLPGAAAESWLAETLFNPRQAMNRPIFKIQNPELRGALALKPKKKSLYSFHEVSQALDKILEGLDALRAKEESDRSLVERRQIELYGKTLIYFQLSRSLSFLLPIFSIEDPKAAKRVGLAPGKKYKYLDLLDRHQKIKAEIAKKSRFRRLSQGNLEILALAFRMDMASKDENNNLLRIIPPLWRDNPDLWRSPWNLIKTGKGTPAAAVYMARWMDMERAYRTGAGGRSAAQAAFHEAMALAKGFIRRPAIFAEKTLNDWGLFSKSMAFYILSAALLFFGGIFFRAWLLPASFAALATGFCLHFLGLLLRVFIMARPPVATLYESILFVGMALAGAGLFLARGMVSAPLISMGAFLRRLFFWRPPRAPSAPRPLKGLSGNPEIGLLAGSTAGAALHLLAFRYEGAEAMEILAPVLNTNFWLASHVLCITAGYSAALVASLLAHIYIFLSCFRPGFPKKSLAALYESLTRASLFALFFCLFGTVLGGIWADQSWGRFWGWDPKENGALFLILWLLVLLHGRMGGLFQARGYALGHVLTAAAVALSWFGVNLLGAGLHSYGFTSGAAWGLALFCGAEAALFLFGLINLRRAGGRAGEQAPGF